MNPCHDKQTAAAPLLAVLRFGSAAAAGTVVYQVMQGNLMTVFVHWLGFTPFFIGLLFFVTQIVVVGQIWSARYADRNGCKKMMLVSFAAGPVALMPLIFFPQARNLLGITGRDTVIFLSLTLFSLCNAAAGSAWMPMLRHNVPLKRGAQLVAWMNFIATLIGAATTMGFSFTLGSKPTIGQFQFIFLCTAILAAMRTVLVRNTRDVDVQTAHAPEPLWRDMDKVWKNLPFRRLCIFMSIWFLGTGLIVPFRPLFLNTLGFDERFAVLVTVSLNLLVFGLAAPLWGILADRFGSRGVYVLGGIGVTTGHLIMSLPQGNTTFDAAIFIFGLVLMQASWGGFDSGNIRRLFTVVPTANQSLYMVLYQLCTAVPLAVGGFLGGTIVKMLHEILGQTIAQGGFARAIEYRVLFLLAAVTCVVAIGYSRRMAHLKEASTPRMLLYLRLRTQRWLMYGLATTMQRLRIR